MDPNARFGVIEVSKARGFGRKKDYYKLCRVQRNLIRRVTAARRGLKCIEATGLLCAGDGQAQCDRFANHLKKDYRAKFLAFVDQFIEKAPRPRRRAKARDSGLTWQQMFERFFQVRVGNLPNIHILFWLRLVDFRAILANFRSFMARAGAGQFEAQLRNLENDFSMSSRGGPDQKR